MRLYIRLLLISVSAILSGSITAHSQTIVTASSSNDYASNKYTIRFKIIDETSSEPIPFASVYLTPYKDTVITHFTISGQDGSAELTNIAKGAYLINIELLGYVKYQKDITVNASRVLKDIKLKESKDYINAATITSLAEPVQVKTDTIIYNASAFRVGNNAMLEELLKTMPGIEITNGKVTVNGKAVTEITVNGRTFFFGDMQMALANLPARIVNRIKVTDKANKETAASRLRSSATDERVMDVELKEEFATGNFGNLCLSGGSVWDKHIEDDSSLKGVYQGNAFGSIYGKRDQVTIVANGDNIAVSNGYKSKVGVNYNTDRISGISTNVSLLGTVNKTVSDNSSDLSYYIDNESISSKTQQLSSVNKIYGLSIFGDLKNDYSKKISFEFKPDISFSITDYSHALTGFTKAYYGTENRSMNMNNFKSNSWISLNAKNLGKERRYIALFVKYTQNISNGDRTDLSEMTYDGSSNSTYLDYDMKNNNLMVNSTLTYNEPISKKWAFNFQEVIKYDYCNAHSLATDLMDNSRNDKYSNISKLSNYSIQEDILMKYAANNTELFAGCDFTHFKSNVSSANSYDNYWKTRIAPYLKASFNRRKQQLYLGSFTTPVGGNDIQPSIRIISPSEITVGNIYLKQAYSYELSEQYTYYGKCNLNLILSTQLETNGIVEANWFDNNGIRNSIPVNTKTPSGNIKLWGTASFYLDKKKHWYTQLFTDSYFRTTKGYQSSTYDRNMIDSGTFDYDELIYDIFGNFKGDRFYSGQSGFKKSNTNILNLSGYIYWLYRLKNLSISFQLLSKYYKSQYSFIKSAGKDVLQLRAIPSVTYTFPFNLTATTSLAFSEYRGYGKLLDCNTWNWSVKLSTSYKMLSFSIDCSDLLNQTMSLGHLATSEYCSTSQYRTLGRQITASVAYNFGKGNKNANNKANSFVRNSERY